MPKYYFECEYNKCNHIEEIIALMSEYDNIVPLKCPKCGHKVHQLLFPPEVNIPKTLGSMADKNTRTMSKDQREEIARQNTAYLNEGPSWEDTPDGIKYKIKQ